MPSVPVSASATDLADLGAVALRDLVMRRGASAAEVARAALRRVEAVNPHVNACVAVDPEFVMAQAASLDRMLALGEDPGPLVGVPVTIKDDKPTKDLPTTYGSVLFADHRPRCDALIVHRLRRAGAIVVAKTNLPDFGWKGDTANALHGPTRNPHDLTRTAGGSSGGAAAAVATGMGALAQGGDAGGSIRIPAAMCGVIGLKPTHGRVPYEPSSIDELLVAEGPLVRAVADARAMLDVLSGPTPLDRWSASVPTPPIPSQPLRIAVATTLGSLRCDAPVTEAVRGVAARLSDAGYDVADIELPFGDEVAEVFTTQFQAAFATLHRTGWGLDPPIASDDALAALDPSLRAVTEAGLLLDAADVGTAQLRRIDIEQRMEAFFTRFDVLLSPTVPTVPFVAGADHPDTSGGQPVDVYSWVAFTAQYNLSGLPAVSVPTARTNDGWPLAVQLGAARGGEELLLRVAAVLEEHLSWDPRPVAVDGLSHPEPTG